MPSKDERPTTRNGCKGRCVARSVARQRLNCRSAVLLATTALVAATEFAPSAARAQDATWLLNPASGDYKTAANWNPATVPLGTASFGTSNTTALTFSTGGAADGWTFNAGASAYIRSPTVRRSLSPAPASSLTVAAPPSLAPTT